MSQRNYETDPEVIVAPIVVEVYQELTPEKRLELIATLQAMDEEVSDALGDSISDFGVTVCGELIAIAFGTDGVTGDSAWEGNITQPYTNQSFDELHDNMIPAIKESMKLDSLESAEIEWNDMFADELMGFWIVPKAIVDTYEMPDCHSDGALYAALRSFKTFLQANALITLLKG